MSTLEAADIFRDHGSAWRRANAGHVSLGQLKVMSAIERCPALAGKPPGRPLLPVDYYQVVFTLPAPISNIAYQNKAIIYNLLFKAAAETLLTIAADPKRLGAHLGITAVLHTWGSSLTHHPHIHCIVPGAGLSLEGERWVACKPGFFLPVRVLSRLFRRLFLEKLRAAHDAGRLQFFGQHQPLADAKDFNNYLSPLRNIDCVNSSAMKVPMTVSTTRVSMYKKQRPMSLTTIQPPAPTSAKPAAHR